MSTRWYGITVNFVGGDKDRVVIEEMSLLV